MQIQRYLPKDRQKRELFGQVLSQVHHWDFDWYFGENKIGLSPNPSTEAESFIAGILVADDEILVMKSEDYITIKRKNDPFATIGRHDSPNLEERLKLAELLTSNEQVHLYSTEEKSGGYNRILTFSKTAPSKELYVPGKILQVTIEKA